MPMKKTGMTAMILLLLLLLPAGAVRAAATEEGGAAAEAIVTDETAAAGGAVTEDAVTGETGETPAGDGVTENTLSGPDASLFPSRWPKGPEVSARAAYVLETSLGIPLYSLNAHEKLYPASTTKLLTCLLAMDYLTDLSVMVPFSEKAVLSVPSDGSSIGIDPGESLSARECIYGILVGSANECSNALAEFCCGSIEEFVDKMNEKAASLGCTDSHFANTNGYHDDNHYTSAHDLALIGAAFFNNDFLREAGNTRNYHFVPTATQRDDFWLKNKHQLINGTLPFEGVIGGKTGYTSKAEQTLVTGAQRGEMRLVCVVLKEKSPLQFTDTAALLSYGFESFGLISPSELASPYASRRPEYLRSGPDLLGHAFGSLEADKNARILLPKTLSPADVEVVLRQGGDEEKDKNAFAHLIYSFEGMFLGRASLSYLPAPVEKAKQTDGTFFINVRSIVLSLLGVLGFALLAGSLAEFTKSYAFTRRRDIWKSRLDSRKRHKKPF